MLNIVIAAICLIIALGSSKFAGYMRAKGDDHYHKYSILTGVAVAVMVYFVYPLIDKSLLVLGWPIW